MLASHPAGPWRHRVTRPRSLASIVLLAVTAISAVIFLGIPNLRRLHLQLGSSLFDSGLYGFYQSRRYHSFGQESLAVELVKWDSKCSDEYVFIAPHGPVVENSVPMILDARGELVWRMPFSHEVNDFRVQEYRGEKYLTFWHDGGSWSMLDSSYRHRFEVRPAGPLVGNMHDFRITENGTALITIYDTIRADLSMLGGPEHGYLRDGLFQEVDIADGTLLFEWRMSDYVPVNASFEALRGTGWRDDLAYDAYHINSIDKDASGNYILSSRHTHSIYSIDGKSGKIIWTLGGKLNDFDDASGGRATDFAWQHDARLHDNHTLTLLDNQAEWFLDEPTHSRALTLDLDVPKRVASVRTTYIHPAEIRASSQGNVQVLSESGNVFVGWGHCAAYTEFSPEGEPLCEGHFGAANWFQLGQVYSYRATRGRWIGQPDTRPAAAAAGSSVFVSWNGATEVAFWRLERGDGPGPNELEFESVKIVEKEGFETGIELPPDLSTSYYRVAALNRQKDILGATKLFGAQPSRSLGDIVRTHTVEMFSFGELFSIFMLGLSFLMILVWASKFCACRLRSRRYRLISFDSGLSASEELPLSSVSWSERSCSLET